MTTLEKFADFVKDKKISVVGIGISNTPVITMLAKLGAKVSAFDKNEKSALGDVVRELEALSVNLVCGEHYLDDISADIVIKTPGMIYGIETNFYGSGGSKLNETARSYKTLAWETEDIDGFTFVWFTDGKGWTSARNNLEETFDVMQHIYNIKDLENGVIREVFK